MGDNPLEQEPSGQPLLTSLFLLVLLRSAAPEPDLRPHWQSASWLPRCPAPPGPRTGWAGDRAAHVPPAMSHPGSQTFPARAAPPPPWLQPQPRADCCPHSRWAAHTSAATHSTNNAPLPAAPGRASAGHMMGDPETEVERGSDPPVGRAAGLALGGGHAPGQPWGRDAAPATTASPPARHPRYPAGALTHPPRLRSQVASVFRTNSPRQSTRACTRAGWACRTQSTASPAATEYRDTTLPHVMPAGREGAGHQGPPRPRSRPARSVTTGLSLLEPRAHHPKGDRGQHPGPALTTSSQSDRELGHLVGVQLPATICSSQLRQPRGPFLDVLSFCSAPAHQGQSPATTQPTSAGESDGVEKRFGKEGPERVKGAQGPGAGGTEQQAASRCTCPSLAVPGTQRGARHGKKLRPSRKGHPQAPSC